MQEQFTATELVAWVTLGLPVDAAMQAPVRLTVHSAANGGTRAVVHTARPPSSAAACSAPCTGSGDVVELATLVPAVASAHRADPRATLTACPVCRQGDPQMEELFALLAQLRTAAGWANTQTRLREVSAALRDTGRTPSALVLHQLLTCRRHLEFPTAAGSPSRVQQHLPPAALAGWWGDQLPRWQREVAAAVSLLRSRLVRPQGAMHLVAPSSGVGRPGAGHAQLAFPEPGAVLLPYVACAELVGVLPWAHRQHGPVFAIPAHAARAGTASSRTWVDLGPADQVGDIELLTRTYTAMFTHRPATPADVAALHQALREPLPA